MKKQFTVFIHSNGFENESLLKMIGNHNSGKATIDIETMEAYLKAEKARYPDIFKNIGWILDEENKHLDIWEGGKDNFTLHIEEIEVHELVSDKVFHVHELLNPILAQYALDNNLNPKKN